MAADTYARLDELVDTDPLRLRDEAFAFLQRAEQAETDLAVMQTIATERSEACGRAEAELKNMTLAYNGANAMAAVHKRRADLLRAELDNAKAALAGDNEGIARFMADCDARAKRAQEQTALSQRSAETAEADADRLDQLLIDEREITRKQQLRAQKAERQRDTLEAENDYRRRREEYLTAAIERVRAYLDATERHCSDERRDTPSWVARIRAALDTPTPTGGDRRG